ncbi:Rrf2 family transcriptional regulator [Denitrobaculum tricleocarpae]|uniref:Rrf2 family transcriptional regulator n=1 Tax=Denitrobaculum tricleocarpae TaxID=2591009 RepID=A0A545U0T1_9PROT|nr:Rrf2 family transcriptional regulator [Denitrobaculum tricleocarpae]TQV83068.1 Rrf2 family transcriptional regulator [Denitrobaculum tricleocarpae]
MRLTRYTDYALRLLMFLGTHPDELCTIQQIAEVYGISKNHLMKITHQLGQAGYVETLRGRGGGLRLAKPPSRIRVGDVIRVTEEDLDLVECFNKDRNSCVITKACRLQGVLSEALDAYLAVLDRYSLEDLLADDSALRSLLSNLPGNEARRLPG